MSRSRLRYRAGSVSITLAMLLTGPTWAQISRDLNGCAGQAPIEQQIDACTARIGSAGTAPQDLAEALGNRGRAYVEKREYDLAVKDRNEEIRIRFHLVACALVGRADAYRHKAEYDHAIRDYGGA